MPERDETFQLAPGMPPLHTSELPWINFGAAEWETGLFDVSRETERLSALAEVVVCNSFPEVEAAAFPFLPNVLPVGPLTSDRELRKPVGQLLPEDSRCLPWLDAQPDGSVVYVAFGSSTTFDPRQFRELAEGLELIGRPFLWVVRTDFTTGDVSKAWFDEFKARIAGAGMVVSWCPQQKVLAHRAVACFVSHCGWNSIMEGVRNGVPFLGWPYFADQFLDRNYVTDVWRTGLAVSPGADGVVTKEELRSKVEQVLGDGDIRERARVFMDASRRCIRGSGSSCENFNKFVNLLSE